MKTTIQAWLLLFFMLLISNDEANAQSRYSVSAGVGRYELSHLAAHLHISSSCSFALIGGSNFGVNNNTQYSLGLAFDQTLFKSKEWKIKPGYSINTILWTRDDELYYFKTLSFPLMLSATYNHSSLISFRVEGGTTLSKTLVSDRKQNVTSGYPEYINGNFKLSVVYHLSQHKK